ncbi:DNA repair exonuclease [Bacillus sp. S/N-304-OC-R1]|uniref:metallophosphoesterase family protein n=1 Tax=Bacillus sp. S/N-304-OC-R1 TaxID=2758034 RepID=UPI001C8DD3A9|nr:DNA repair exonuclease [Bacillus sp. S/N-304-OC-R1]MBY0123086.1 DNA repair exonuclease [Bacillus sp. S/N-304-OC-R1]
MKKVTFIHAADLHLDSPMIGLKNLPPIIFKRLQESTFEALARIVDAAIFHGVDFVIFAGDLFDGEDRSIRAQIRFRNEMERLANSNIAVFVVHGNHDHLGGSWAHISLPGHVYTFLHEVEVFRFCNLDGISVHIYGFSYPRRHVFERMIADYKKEQGADFHIGILHGNLEGSTEHDKYAPFSIRELNEKGFDYWALGHIHKRQTLQENPPIIYPGNTQGRHRKETGEKGCYLVQLNDEGANIKFIEASSIVWEEQSLDASNAASFQEIYELCKNSIQSVRKENKGIILSLSIDNIDLADHDRRIIANGELLEILQEEEKDEEAFVWVSNLKINEKWRWDREQFAKESDFYSELFHTVMDYSVEKGSISALYHHPGAKNLLQSISEEERNVLIEEAENLLVHLLNKE